MKTINYKDLEWIVLEEKEGKTKLLLKDVLDEEHIKKYYDGDDIMIDGSDVRHQDNIRTFDWNKSYIKNVILENMKKDLDESEIDLLTKDEFENLDDDVKECNDWYWTKTSCDGTGAYVWYVVNYGYLFNSHVTNGFGVRPVINLSSKYLKGDSKSGDFEEKLKNLKKEINKLHIKINELQKEFNDLIE